MSLPRTLTRLAAVAAIVFALGIGTAAAAFGATGDPVLGVVALADKLDHAGPGGIPGYLKTVVKGSEIVTIPVDVLALTGDSPFSSQILFEATGTLIAKYGGIVSGMSGSPIYVEDGGGYKVIGALAYGDAFTLGGSGLATPIEAMLAIRDTYAPRVSHLAEPVLMSGRLIDRVIVSGGPGALSAAAASGAFVARPLSSVFIGGRGRPDGRASDRLAASLAARGFSVVRLGSGLSAGASDFSTELVPGAAIGALASRGDLWVGSLGTVTYADGGEVLAFGHPDNWSGPASMYMTNAWITGIWPSLQEPYKLGYPSAIQGTITQDRAAGIMGEVGAPPAEVPFTAEATDVDTDSSAESSVWFSSSMIDAGRLGGAGEAACSIAGYNLFDSAQIPGSADVTATVVVSDGANERTVTIANMYDDPSDVIAAMTKDVDLAVDSLVHVSSAGVEAPHIVSADLQAGVTARRRFATIARVDALAPLRAGDNAVRVSLFAYGSAATQTVDTVITIPEGMPLAGTLFATCVNSGEDSSDWADPSLPPVTAPATTAEVVDALNGSEPNNALTVVFVPAGAGSGGPTALSASGASSAFVKTDTTTPWVLTGTVSSLVTEIEASADPITFGDDAYVDGIVSGPAGPVTVNVYGIPAGGTAEVLLASGDAEPLDGALAFSIPVGGLASGTELRVAVDGGDGYTPAETYTYVTVGGRVSLSAARRTIWRGAWAVFTAKVAPRGATGTVRFQYYDAHAKKWRTISTKRLTHTASSARATLLWRPGRGTWKVRAVYGGDLDLAGALSPSVSVRVR
jgi:hypothetical protein